MRIDTAQNVGGEFITIVIAIDPQWIPDISTLHINLS